MAHKWSHNGLYIWSMNGPWVVSRLVRDGL